MSSTYARSPASTASAAGPTSTGSRLVPWAWKVSTIVPRAVRGAATDAGVEPGLHAALTQLFHDGEHATFISVRVAYEQMGACLRVDVTHSRRPHLQPLSLRYAPSPGVAYASDCPHHARSRNQFPEYSSRPADVISACRLCLLRKIHLAEECAIARIT
jgi:hypothetical protein